MKKGNKSFKVIIDTNIWISFLIGKSLKGLQDYIDSQKVTIVTCEEQVKELIEVFQKSKIQKLFTQRQIADFFDLLEEASVVVEIKTKTSICRDPKDNYLLSLSIDSFADYLITGDSDLLDLDKIENTLIIRYNEFSRIILE